MNWILDNLQIVVIVAGAILYWLKERFERKMAERHRQEESLEESEFPEGEEYSEPLIGRHSLPPPLDAVSAPPASASESAAKSRRLRVAGNLSRIRDAKSAKTNTTGGAAATRSRVTTGTGKAAAVNIPVRLRARLRDRAEVRRAIVMQEILSPPVGLR